ncbi:unnamed protein product [Symbiodinium natans]|uniref:Uncharacterized protein n=1 Tax=Symbiodinium natans TaxID=878477 RepID=A0A812HNL0_9DINO|nr:unnamed protein product [Symbiodinium natans]
MALLGEAFALGGPPPTLPVARLASKPGRAAHEVPERGSSSTLAAAATVLAGCVVAKRRSEPRAVSVRATSLEADPEEEDEDGEEAGNPTP